LVARGFVSYFVRQRRINIAYPSIWFGHAHHRPLPSTRCARSLLRQGLPLRIKLRGTGRRASRAGKVAVLGSVKKRKKEFGLFF